MDYKDIYGNAKKERQYAIDMLRVLSNNTHNKTPISEYRIKKAIQDNRKYFIKHYKENNSWNSK